MAKHKNAIQARIAETLGVSRQFVSLSIKGEKDSGAARQARKLYHELKAQQERKERAKQERQRIAALSDEELLAWLDSQNGHTIKVNFTGASLLEVTTQATG